MSAAPRLYSPYDEPMWESIRNGRMRLQRCADCGAFRYPPGPACPDCGALDSEWTEISGRATLLSWTRFHRQYLPAYPPPSLVIAVKLEEGPIMVSNLIPGTDEALTLGIDLEMDYATHPEGYRIPSFRPPRR